VWLGRAGTPRRDAGLPNRHGLAIGTEALSDLWSKGVPPDGEPCFATMAQVCDEWAQDAERLVARHGAALCAFGTDPSILTLGIELLRLLPRSTQRQVVVHGDFNPGNLLAASRAPYLAIDPKPTVGDPGGLWMAAEGNTVVGARWIRSATITASMVS